MKFRGVFIICVLSFLLFFTLSSAQIDSNVQNQIEDSAKSLEQNISKIREFGEKEKWAFIFSGWKEIALKSKPIALMNTFFTKINIVFVILLGMNWDLSLRVFFAILFSSVAFIFLNSFAYVYIDKTWQKLLASLGAVILLAQSGLFRLLSNLTENVIFFKLSENWRIAGFILLIGVITILVILNRLMKKSLIESVKKRRSKNKELRLKKIEAFQESLREGKNLSK